MFAWPHHDEGDYLDYRPMTKAQIEEVEKILNRAEALGTIRPNWYVGTITLSSQTHEDAIGSLLDTLNLDLDLDEKED